VSIGIQDGGQARSALSRCAIRPVGLLLGTANLVIRLRDCDAAL
jgi:hypothetical protein